MINPSIPAQTLGEFVTHAKANPGKLSFGSGGVGSQAHMGGELLKAMTGIDMLHVAYKGVGDSMKDLLGGQLSMVCAQVPSAAPLVRAGIKGFEAVSWYGLVGPAGMPADVVSRIQSEVAKAVQSPEVRDKMLGMGAEPVGSTQAQLIAVMKQDYDRYGAIIKRLGIKAD